MTNTHQHDEDSGTAPDDEMREENIRQAVGRMAFESATGRHWRTAESDPGLDPAWRDPSSERPVRVPPLTGGDYCIERRAPCAMCGHDGHEVERLQATMDATNELLVRSRRAANRAFWFAGAGIVLGFGALLAVMLR